MLLSVSLLNSPFLQNIVDPLEGRKAFDATRSIFVLSQMISDIRRLRIASIPIALKL